MAVAYPGTMAELGAELKVLRAPEALWEYAEKADGSTYLTDQLNSVYDNSVNNEDDVELDSRTSLEEDVMNSVIDIHEARKTSFEEYWLEQYLGIKLIGMDEAEAAAGAIQYVYDDALLALGQVQILTRKGPLGRLRADMVANSQTILKPSSLSAAGIAAVSGNIGTVAEASVTVSDHTLAGTMNIECVDDTIGATKLSVKLVLTIPLIDGTTTIEADNEITLAKAFEDGPTGFGITLSLSTLVESGDNGNMFASTTITNPGEADGNKGKFFFRVVRMSGTGGNPDFRIYWYNDSSQEPSELIATQDITGTTGSIAVSMQGSTTTIATTFSKANAATLLASVNDEDNDIIFDIDNPRIGDKWTKAITNNQDANFASKIARRWRASLPSLAAGNTINDNLAPSVSMS